MRSFRFSLFLILLSAALLSSQAVRAQFSQQGSKLVGNDNAGISWQGNAVALSADGNTAIVGGPNDNGTQGALWVYTRSAGVWTQQGPKLVGTGMNICALEYFGYSVALSRLVWRRKSSVSLNEAIHGTGH